MDLQTYLLVLARLVLAAVFLYSGIVKLRSVRLAALALVDFGVVRRLRPRLGLALAVYEVLLGIALAASPFDGGSQSWTIAGIAALATLLVFAAGLARALRQGKEFPCFCFGSTGGSLSWRTFGRTAALAVAAALTLLPVQQQSYSVPQALQLFVSVFAVIGLGAVTWAMRLLYGIQHQLLVSSSAGDSPEASRP